MRMFVIAAAAAGTLLVAGAAASAEPVRLAQADVNVRIGGGDGMHHRDRGYHRGWHARGGCKTVTIKERHGNRVVIKKIRHC